MAGGARWEAEQEVQEVQEEGAVGVRVGGYCVLVTIGHWSIVKQRSFPAAFTYPTLIDTRDCTGLEIFNINFAANTRAHLSS